MDAIDKTKPVFEIYALRNATSQNRRRYHNCNFCENPDIHESKMPMDFFVWVIRNEKHVILVDTGSRDWKCNDRGHQFIRCPIESLSALNIKPEDVDDVVITHMHWDHAGNIDKLPNARIHIQLDEMRSATGPDMAIKALNNFFLVDDVCTVIKRLYAGAVTYHHAGAENITDGVALHSVGGHTPGMQIVRVRTQRGWVVLASDASHFYLNYQQKNPFPVFFNLHDTIKAWETCELLADGPDHVIPGHDPLVLQKYPVAHSSLGAEIVRLDLPPLR
jgi:glyoxylase-like metal-dependent hydrolase (beta-lactamase superfamily II)